MIALDDNIEDHPKFVSLSDAAFALWIRCIGYCRRNLTDGYVPEQAARARVRSGKAAAVIQELLSPPEGLPNGNPLWVRVPGGYRVHDYLDWNPSKEDVEEIREKKRAAAARGGQASGRTRAKQAAERAEAVSLPDGRTKDEAPCFDSGSPLAKSDPIRSDPDPRSSLEGGAEDLTGSGAHGPTSEHHHHHKPVLTSGWLLAEMRRHPSLGAVANEDFAGALLGVLVARPRPLDLVAQGIAESAVDVAGHGLTGEAIGRKVRTYVTNAKRADGAATSRRGANAIQPPTLGPDVGGWAKYAEGTGTDGE